MTPPPLAVVPTYLRSQQDIDVVATTLVTFWATARDDADLLVVDDGSPARELLPQLEAICAELGADLHLKEDNGGFASTVNVGLRRALEEGRDAVLVNADIEFHDPRWLTRMLARTDTTGAPASVVGGLLLFPNGLIQHGGVVFSDLHRAFDHRFRFAPGNLPEAHETTRCPVTAALQLIRHECLAGVGLYDEEFRLAFEDVDYCLRVFDSGRECIYEPTVTAIHHEGMFRLQTNPTIESWIADGLIRLMHKHRRADFSQWVVGLG